MVIDKNELVSIIVPIYGVEQYLAECIESLIKQTYTNLEIILINDGSLDNCGNICDTYAQKDCRIIVLHKENGGVSAARRDGFTISTGEWVTFVDADDALPPDAIELLYSYTAKGDCIVGMFTPPPRINIY